MRLPRIAAFLCLILSVLLAGIVFQRLVPSGPGRSALGDTPHFELGWDPATAAQGAAARATVASQIDAFRRDDYERAVSYMAPRFGPGSAQRMRHMITAYYPEFAHPRRVTFGPVEIQHRGGRVRVPIHILGEDGYQARALYYLYPIHVGYRIEAVDGGGRMMRQPPGPH